jgi:PhzF family phenazine biosynthesis protein
MEIPVYIVDAFAEKFFTGNPAAVCPLDEWLDDKLMQNIAAENNLAETAFIVKEAEGFRIRWFTPVDEVDLCGHATLASAHVFFNHLGYSEKEISFNSRGGILKVSKTGDMLKLDFPTDKIEKADAPDFLLNAFTHKPVEVYKGKLDYMLIFEDQLQIEEAKPVMDLIAQSGTRGVIITAKGNEADFVSRYFAPQFGIHEDPATGSAHTTLIPYWHEKLGKTEMKAVQLSQRRGYFSCAYRGERVDIAGKAFTYSEGKINI